MNATPEAQIPVILSQSAIDEIIKEAVKDKPIKGIEVRMIFDPVNKRDVPQILCQCGNFNQNRFDQLRSKRMTPDKFKPWRKVMVEMNILNCWECDRDIPVREFNEILKKLPKTE